MKRIVIFVVAVVALTSCENSEPPKEVSKQFVKSLYLLDYDKAASLTSSHSKYLVEGKKVKPMDASLERRNASLNEVGFNLDSLEQTVMGTSASVENRVIHLNLVKENKQWKVIASEKVLDEIINRNDKLVALQSKWDLLKQAFDNRNIAVKDYIVYVTQNGNASNVAQEVLEKINNTALEKNFSKEQLLNYVKAQDEISAMAEQIMQPSFTANADLSINFIVRIGEAEKRIQEAKRIYNGFALAVKSSTFDLLPNKMPASISN